MMSSISAGKLRARKNGDKSKIIGDNKDESRLAEFYFNFFLLGYSVALVILLFELLDSFVHKIMGRGRKEIIDGSLNEGNGNVIRIMVRGSSY